MSQVQGNTDAHMEGTSPITVPDDPIAAVGSDMVSPPASQPSADIPVTANSLASRSQTCNSTQNDLKTHAPSGYTYKRDEDAPGWGWKNKRAQEEMHKAARDVEARTTVVGSKAFTRSSSNPLEQMLTLLCSEVWGPSSCGRSIHSLEQDNVNGST